MFSANATAWHYLFAIFNGTNGLILLIMYSYGRAQAFYRVRAGANTTSSSNVPTQETQMPERKESVCSQETSGSDDF
jgi:hypothetical protein